MDIDVVWRTPVRLKAAPESSDQDFEIEPSDAKRMPDGPGVYIFARKHGGKHQLLYVGQADNLKVRVAQHLRQNVSLMKALRLAKKGPKVVLIGAIKTKQGQQVARVLEVVERNLIAEAVSAGHDLINKQLTSAQFHTVTSTGPKSARGPFDRTCFVPIVKKP